MGKKWEEMSAQEKQEAQFEKLLALKDSEGNDLPFQSPEAKADCQARLTRLKDAIQMKKTPDRVPVTILPSLWPVMKAGMTVQEAMYNYDKTVAAFKDFLVEYKPDMHMGAAAVGSGKFLEILDYKLYHWPGHGVAPEHSYQAIEGEYMKPEEYDIFVMDPSYYFSNFYMPRAFGALGGWTMLPFLPGILEIYGVAGNFIPYALPPVQETFKALTEAGAEGLKWAQTLGAFEAEMMSLGYVNLLANGFSKAPFDILGDTLRGTKGIILDMYRRPDKLLAALEALVPIAINMGVGATKINGNPLVFMPLHKAADVFLSDDQFKKFYWPTFRKVLIGLIEEGCIPFPALEGHWDSRLEIIKDIPKGKTVWMVDQSDIHKVKETLGQVACLCGNVSSSMLLLSTPDEVGDYCKKLIDTVGRDGGYIMSNGAFFDEAKPENVKVMVETAKEYGAYR